MKLMFDKLRTSDGKVKISFDNETTWTEYNVDDIKNTGIEFTEGDCPDLTKIRIAGAITKIGDIKTHISNGSFSQDLTADEKVESLNSRFLNFQYDLDSNDENLVDITNNGTDITNEVNVFENTIQKKPNTMIYYKRTDKEDSTWQKLEETSFDNNMITLYKEIIASRTNGEFIKLGYDTYYNISYRDYTRDQLINIYNDALENGYETQDEALSRIFDSLEVDNQNLRAGIQQLQNVQEYHMNIDDIMNDLDLIKNSYIKAVSDMIFRGFTAYNEYINVINGNDTYFDMNIDTIHISKDAYTYNDDTSATVHSLFRISSSTDPYCIPFKIRLPKLSGITTYFVSDTPRLIALGILEILKTYLEEENTAVIAWLFESSADRLIDKNIEQFDTLQVISEDNQYKIQGLRRLYCNSTPVLKYKYIY